MFLKMLTSFRLVSDTYCTAVARKECIMEYQGIKVVFCCILMAVFVCCLEMGDFMITDTIKLTKWKVHIKKVCDCDYQICLRLVFIATVE